MKGTDMRLAEGDLIRKSRVVHIFNGGRICRPTIIDGTLERGERIWKKEGECQDPQKYGEVVNALGLQPCKHCMKRFELGNIY